MSTPRPTEGISIRALPLAVFALILLVPFLNFEFTLYRSTLKLFVFQTAMALLWGYVAWEWAAGRLHRQEAGGAGWPAWWLFAPVAAWVAWGAATALWSPQGWLATGWLVQGAYGAAGALGLALLLRDAGHRRMFVAAASAVAGALAFLMLLFYGDPATLFFGDIDHLPGRAAGAAFLLLPTLVAAALLYRYTQKEARPEAHYRGVIWLAVLFVLFLLAGARTGAAAWRYGVGAGLLLLLWLVLPRWRLVAVALAVALAALAAQRELAEGAKAAAYYSEAGDARNAVLDTAEWRLVRQAPLGRLLAGNGVGTFRLAMDTERPTWTYAVTHGDQALGHARRQLTEDLFERGVVGLALGVAMGLAWVVAGVLAFRRARDPFDSALGAGLAAAGVALGAFACFSNGAIGFGPSMVFWLGLGLLGALSAESGRPAGLSWSAEEDAWRREGRPRVRPGATAAAVGGTLAIALAWFFLAARPFWAEYCLRDGMREDEAAKRLFNNRDLAERALEQGHLVAKRTLADFDAKIRSAEDALRAASAALDEAAKRGADDAKAKDLAAQRQAAADALEKARANARQVRAKAAAAIRQVEETIEGATAECEEAARRGDRLLRRAARLSLGDRVWLDAQIRLALSYAARGSFAEALARFERLHALCGPALDFDLQRAACHARLGAQAKGSDAERIRREHFAQAHQLYRRYAAKNPFGSACTLFVSRSLTYRSWSELIDNELYRKNPEARQWAEDLIAAVNEGLLWLPRLYSLLLIRADMNTWLGRVKEARADVAAASAIIEEAIGDTPTEYALTRARLYAELAKANVFWNPDKAYKWALQVRLERANPADPLVKEVYESANHTLARLKRLSKKAPEPSAPKAPAPQKAKDGEPTGGHRTP
ncbi:MAG: hypothetical protein FJ291_17535 [Planctomycetes bacterium]|nr:hypothetical protein [Planctomycetota bacterium]